MTDLQRAAQAVLDRWDSPNWEWLEQGPTAVLMANLRKALAEPDAVLAEREACAKVCDELAYFDAGDSAEAMRHCAQDIRARNESS
jgi:hypothetical protein